MTRSNEDRIKERYQRWLVNFKKEQAKRIRQQNRGNKHQVFNPQRKEMMHPDYQVYLNEALLNGMDMMTAHQHARMQIRQAFANRFAANEESEPDPNAR